ncbi:hypothetical protein AXF42_Ash013479 [Apostasia shenzhenica]|uniref:Secreted protein n=1 Tax=Apostasia shenzhenica TaxID=1088818 RepID=A0A2I0A4C5_9ASPA|nr:hypothetical protein AXF42_Ash013479 [Apostasia shenzhenica]
MLLRGCLFFRLALFLVCFSPCFSAKAEDEESSASPRCFIVFFSDSTGAFLSLNPWLFSLVSSFDSSSSSSSFSASSSFLSSDIVFGGRPRFLGCCWCSVDTSPFSSLETSDSNFNFLFLLPMADQTRISTSSPLENKEAPESMVRAGFYLCVLEAGVEKELEESSALKMTTMCRSAATVPVRSFALNPVESRRPLHSAIASARLISSIAVAFSCWSWPSQGRSMKGGRINANVCITMDGSTIGN